MNARLTGYCSYSQTFLGIARIEESGLLSLLHSDLQEITPCMGNLDVAEEYRVFILYYADTVCMININRSDKQIILWYSKETISWV